MAGIGHNTSPSEHATAEDSKASAAEVLCPECGWREGTKPGRPYRLVQSPNLIPGFLLIASVIAVIAWGVTGSLVGELGSGMMHAPFVEPPRTIEDVTSIATSGDRAAASALARDMLQAAIESDQGTLPGERGVSIGFAAPTQRRNEITSAGWPSPWWRTTRAALYEDAFGKQGRIPSRTDTTAAPTPANHLPRDIRLVPPPQGPMLTSGSLFIRRLPEHTNGVLTYTTISPGSIATIPAAGLLAWGLMMLVTVRWHRGERGRTRRRVCFWVGLLVASSLVVAGVANASRQDPRLSVGYLAQQSNQTGEAPFFVRQGCQRLSWTLAELESRIDEPGFAAQVVSEIASIQAEPGMYLTAATVPEANYVDSTLLMAPAAFPLVIMYEEYYVRRSDFGPVAPMAGEPGLSVNVDQYAIGIALGTGKPDQPVQGLDLYYNNIALLVLGFAAVWWLSRRASLWWWRRRGWRRYQASGRCPQCGYEIGTRVAIPGP